jgi:hypothetical protein
MLANVLIESFVLTDINLAIRKGIAKLKTSPIFYSGSLTRDMDLCQPTPFYILMHISQAGAVVCKLNCRTIGSLHSTAPAWDIQ